MVIYKNEVHVYRFFHLYPINDSKPAVTHLQMFDEVYLKFLQYVQIYAYNYLI